jgi:hypothetical protein
MFQYIWIIAFVIAISYRISVSNKVKNGGVADILSGKEQLFVWILCIFSPILAGAILYYGWIKALPNKAKKANAISLWAALIEIILGITIAYITIKMKLK